MCRAWILTGENNAQNVHYSAMPRFHNPYISSQVIKRKDFINNEKAGGAANSAAEHITLHKAQCSSAGITK